MQNNLKYDLSFIEDVKKKIAQWKHVEQPTGLHVCPKLSEQHANKDKIRKMKVSTCAQVFSYSVSTVPGMPGVDTKATEAADLLLFFDELFDSLNGVSLYNISDKLYTSSLLVQKMCKCFENNEVL
ncbi:hypothetical protein PR048_031986 [Dryococelus australis]|uniref:Transposable element P transposase-like GTP-binding insertion domain-containing protein n=1 Tax=Dryococelus australis TaxID=614101 RepID=A0ABQ9G6V6_9NEOP|nr:hypothetical protein PR048_031986 [Dryococelus australis]